MRVLHASGPASALRSLQISCPNELSLCVCAHVRAAGAGRKLCATPAFFDAKACVGQSIPMVGVDSELARA
eukprot:1135751-Pleurochrysis_carterae.AAC.1